MCGAGRGREGARAWGGRWPRGTRIAGRGVAWAGWGRVQGLPWRPQDKEPSLPLSAEQAFPSRPGKWPAAKSALPTQPAPYQGLQLSLHATRARVTLAPFLPFLPPSAEVPASFPPLPSGKSAKDGSLSGFSNPVSPKQRATKCRRPAFGGKRNCTIGDGGTPIPFEGNAGNAFPGGRNGFGKGPLWDSRCSGGSGADPRRGDRGPGWRGGEE